MDLDDVWRSIDSERLSLAALLDDLSPAEWATPSLCTGWLVRDVAAHLTQAHMGYRDAFVAAVRARGSFDRMIRDAALRVGPLPPEEYGRRIRAMVGSRRRAPVAGPIEPLLDVLVHGQDIAVPLGRERPVPPASAAAAAQRGWEPPVGRAATRPWCPSSSRSSTSSCTARTLRSRWAVSTRRPATPPGLPRSARR